MFSRYLVSLTRACSIADEWEVCVSKDTSSMVSRNIDIVWNGLDACIQTA